MVTSSPRHSHIVTTSSLLRPRKPCRCYSCPATVLFYYKSQRYPSQFTISHGWRRSLRKAETRDTKIRSKRSKSNPYPAPASCTPCISGLMIKVGHEDTFPTFYFPSLFLPVYHIYINRTMILRMGILNESNPTILTRLLHYCFLHQQHVHAFSA